MEPVTIVKVPVRMPRLWERVRVRALPYDSAVPQHMDCAVLTVLGFTSRGGFIVRWPTPGNAEGVRTLQIRHIDGIWVDDKTYHRFEI